MWCPDSIAKQIGGWSGGADVSEGYGPGTPIDRQLTYRSEATKDII